MGGKVGARISEIFLYKESRVNFGFGGGGVARVSDCFFCFQKTVSLKKKFEGVKVREDWLV